MRQDPDVYCRKRANELRSLETMVIGDLISATLLTLYVLPTLYIWFERGIQPPPALSDGIFDSFEDNRSLRAHRRR